MTRSLRRCTRRSLLVTAATTAGALAVSSKIPLSAPAAAALPTLAAKEDWPWWRGADRSGTCQGQLPRMQVAWKAKVAGRGHGSPIIVGQRVYLTTADNSSQQQHVLCLNRGTGKTEWNTQIHQGGFPSKGNKKASLASTTPAFDGQRLFVNFLNGGAVHTTALDLDGKQLWQTKICDYVVHQGYGSSPAVYGPLVIVSADNKGGGAVVGLNRETGAVVWRRERPKTPNYPSPIVLNVADREQLLLTGCQLVTSLDPLTGSKHWEIPGATTECVTSTVTDGRRIFTSGGYPKNHVSAVMADGSGEIAWQNNVRVYVPSMIAHQEHLFAVRDDGVAVCWESATGKEKWKHRLGGTFTSSPLLAGDKLLAINEKGAAFVFDASPKSFRQSLQTDLKAEVYSSPAMAGDQLFLRAAVDENGRRQEYLFCFA